MGSTIEDIMEFEFCFNRSLLFIGALLLASIASGLMRVFNNPFSDFVLVLLYTATTMLHVVTLLKKYGPFTTAETVAFTLLYTHPLNSIIGICIGIFTLNYIAAALSLVWFFVGFYVLQHFAAFLTMVIYSPKKKASPMFQS